MNDISDTVMTLAAVACFAEGPTTIRNVAHIRHKETDRLAALATELRRLGAEVEEFADGLTHHAAAAARRRRCETYNDHRMAMSLALVGLRVPGVVIETRAASPRPIPASSPISKRSVDRRHVMAMLLRPSQRSASPRSYC